MDNLDLIDDESEDVKEYNSKLQRINKLIRLNRKIINDLKEDYGNTGDMTDEDKNTDLMAFWYLSAKIARCWLKKTKKNF